MACTFGEQTYILTLHLVLLDIDVFDHTDLAISLGEEEVLADILESRSLCQLHDIRQLFPGLVTDDSLQIINIDKVGLDIVDDVEEVLDGGTVAIEPEVRRHFG